MQLNAAVGNDTGNGSGGSHYRAAEHCPCPGALAPFGNFCSKWRESVCAGRHLVIVHCKTCRTAWLPQYESGLIEDSLYSPLPLSYFQLPLSPGTSQTVYTGCSLFSPLRNPRMPLKSSILPLVQASYENVIHPFCPASFSPGGKSHIGQPFHSALVALGDNTVYGNPAARVCTVCYHRLDIGPRQRCTPYRKTASASL